MARPKGSPNKTTTEVAEIFRTIINSPKYRANLLKRMEAGEAPPAVETMAWHYAFGKPKDTLEVRTPDPVRVVFEFTASPRA